ncbi:MAG TPA: serine/threonine-protein kinase [Polyangia bacterium]|nr:serine/threonine-protein kinase [Polyangia bacterium]
MEQARIPERYRLIEEVGQGGMAVVYRAQDETLKREVAIKILHQHLAGEADSKARLEREAQAVAKLRHENILEIFDYSGTGSATSFIVTEFIDGQTLKQFLGKHPPRFPEIAALIGVEVCRALGHAHGLGVIHRDVKPENVMIRKDGLIKLMDFGIAQVLDFQRMTVTGQLLGSPAYMAPEIIEGKPLDFRTDVFSVGIMLYLLATGELPFAGKNPHEVLRRISEGRFADPRTVAHGVDQRAARIITRALARRPDDRYPDVAPLADDLMAYLADAGLTDVRAELRGFFADPDCYEKALPARMAAALSAAAATHLRERRVARAMELWNRVLAFDPQNAEVTAALDRLEGRRRLRRVSLALLALGVVAVGGWTGARHLQSRSAARVAARRLSTPETPPPPASPAESAVRTEAGPAAGPQMSEQPRPAHPHPTRARPERQVAFAAPAAPVPTRTFTLGPTPQNVDVYLDGQRQFAYDPAHTSIAIPWNTDHVLELRSPSGCCFVERVEIGPDHPLPPDAIIARRLKWRPARVVVTTEPSSPAARVLVRDPNRKLATTAARPGDEIDVPFFPDDELSKEVEVAVDAGDAFATDRVRVRAGQKLSHVVKLRPGAN